MHHYFWLIPILLMVLMAAAALACDTYAPDVPKVREVETDPQTPGRAYILSCIVFVGQWMPMAGLPNC